MKSVIISTLKNKLWNAVEIIDESQKDFVK